MDADDKLLSAREAADRLSVSPKTLKRWAKQGRIPYVRLPNGYLRFRVIDVEDARKIEPPIERPVVFAEHGGD